MAQYWQPIWYAVLLGLLLGPGYSFCVEKNMRKQAVSNVNGMRVYVEFYVKLASKLLFPFWQLSPEKNGWFK